ncbi:UDP-2,4-diacetamido-2,4,6-trideoxy-beta-L-altropyranose hydrolase [Lacimicrobium sp. SS2-24]|uniref:UDP-2,4-diacetamido-2,4, 6-trideoxy-beta-L-altropyranose hydrolase n=1 Tax=Lacimicrobium sp. SS2-24 TaxID=2005569 RepID=UPI000B4BD53C|nr:UDP-2,4-diacetamido-2,4,6-trideoxy-beta-L-altropyranose hydrolase [Lacimicrobium sp. SS2-24]
MDSVIFRTDGNSEMGLGHLMRCLALAQELDLNQVNATFLVSESSLAFCRSRHDWVGKVIPVPDYPADAEIRWMQQLPEFDQADWIVLDGYQFDQAYRFAIKSTGKLFALFDDNNDSGQLYADLVINGSSHAQMLDYDQTAATAQRCIGEPYRVLRHEFRITEPMPFSERRDLVICFGGSDPSGITLSLLQALESLSASMSVRVITGAAYRDGIALDDFLKRTGLIVQHLPNHQQMADCFSRARLAISAAGGSQFELAACCTPSILAVVAENQRLATAQAEQQGWCEVFDMTQGESVKALAETAVMLWSQSSKLATMHQKAGQFADTMGSSRVFESMSAMLGSDGKRFKGG